MPTWKKLSGFLLSVFILMGMLAIFSDLFLIPIQTFMVESIRSTIFRLPEAGTLPDRNSAEIRQYMRNSLEQEDWPERRTVVIDLDATTARLDFSLSVKEDHDIATVIRSGIARQIPRALVEMVFGNWYVMGTPLADDDFQGPSIVIDTKTDSVIVHLVALRHIEKNASIHYFGNSLLQEPSTVETDSRQEEAADRVEILINHPGRKLVRIDPYPVESADDIIRFDTRQWDLPVMFIETEVIEEPALSLAQILSRQTLLQRVGKLLDIRLGAILIEAILEALPLVIFLLILWGWKGKLPASLLLLSEVVIALLFFHFSYYLAVAISNLYSAVYQVRAFGQLQGEIGSMFDQVYRLFGVENVSVNYLPLGYFSVGTVIMGVLLPRMLIRRCQQWDDFQKDIARLPDPLKPEYKAVPVKKNPSFWSVFTYFFVGLFIAFPLAYYVYAQQNTNIGILPSSEVHLLLVCFLVGIFGVLLMLVFGALYILLDGKPIPRAIGPLAFWVIFIGNLIWSLSYGLQISIQRDLRFEVGWAWLVYATALGAVLVYSMLRLVYTLARQAGLVPQMSQQIYLRLILISILSAIPMRLLFSSSAAPADYYEVMNLAGELDNLIQFIFLAGLTWFFYQQGRKSPVLSRLTLAVGMIAAATVLYPSNAHWLFIPLTFLLGYRLLFNFIKPAHYWKELEPLYTRVFHDRLHFLEELVNLNNGERGYHELHRSLSTKMGKDELSYIQFKEKLDARRAELDECNERAKVHDKPIKDVALTFGPHPTAWENGIHGAYWAAMLSIPWITIWMNNFMAGEVTSSGYPLWSFFADLLNLLISWVGIGFLFGYFYPFLRGKNGLEKGVRFWLVIVLPALPLALVNNTTMTDWQGFFFWVLQVFLHCMLLGLIAFDYMTLRQGYRDWQMLFELHGIPSVGVSISTILIAAGTTVTTLFQERTQEILRAALTFILPQADKLIDAEQVINSIPK